MESIEMIGSSTHKIKNIYVFCGSSPEKENKFLESTNHLGHVLTERKIYLVYGGGNFEIIGGVSTITFLGGCQVLSIILKALAIKNINGKTIKEKLKASTMSE
jgi:predicted Rossmann-fold nucleotide-binding protein